MADKGHQKPLSDIAVFDALFSLIVRRRCNIEIKRLKQQKVVVQ